MNDRVIRYFNAVSEKLAAGHAISSTIKNASDIGYSRENLVKDFLSKHLPGRLSAVLGGHVFGFDQEESKQLDILILNDIGLNFKENDKPFAPIENVAAVFTVKSNLNSSELIDALANIASIPQIDRDVLDFENLMGEPYEYFIKHYPRFNVFAYTGMSLESTLKTIQEFYLNNEVPLNRRPQGIIVNREYYIQSSPEATPLYNGKQSPPYSFNGIKLHEELSGYPLFHVLGPLNGYSSWLNNMRIGYSKYFDSALQKVISGIS